jgi:hypothetical protein
MSRRVLLLLLLVVVLVIGGAAAFVATTRPDLEDRRDTVDTRWAALRVPLTARYDGLDQLTTALGAAGAGDRTYTVDLADQVEAWNALTTRADPDPGAEASAANQLEGLAARARVNVAQSARLSRDPAVAAALAAFDAALVPADQVGAYNRAVRRYQGTRTDTVTQVPADLLGYDPRPILVLGVTPATG